MHGKRATCGLMHCSRQPHSSEINPKLVSGPHAEMGYFLSTGSTQGHAANVKNERTSFACFAVAVARAALLVEKALLSGLATACTASLMSAATGLDCYGSNTALIALLQHADTIP